MGNQPSVLLVLPRRKCPLSRRLADPATSLDVTENRKTCALTETRIPLSTLEAVTLLTEIFRVSFFFPAVHGNQKTLISVTLSSWFIDPHYIMWLKDGLCAACCFNGWQVGLCRIEANNTSAVYSVGVQPWATAMLAEKHSSQSALRNASYGSWEKVLNKLQRKRRLHSLEINSPGLLWQSFLYVKESIN